MWVRRDVLWLGTKGKWMGTVCGFEEKVFFWNHIEGFVIVVGGHSRLVVRYRRIMVGTRWFVTGNRWTLVWNRRLTFGKRKLSFGNRRFGKLYFIIGFSRSVVYGLEGYATVR